MSTTPGSSAPRYRLDGRIATGGMGEVWRATDTVLGREVAVKVLRPEYADDPTFRTRFESEARHAAALHHPNIASVFDYGELPADDGSPTPRPYLVMELVPGKPLSELLREGEPMPADTAADLVAQAADGVAAAHSIGVVHRDVKPGNLLVTPAGQVKITDFGIARAADGATLTQTGQVLGTPAYFSPEQAEGRPATQASDIYSLGVVLYECLAGRRPFVGESPIGTALAHLREDPPALPADVPEHLRRTVETALAKDPQERFVSAAALRDALRGGPVPDGSTLTAPAGVVAGAAVDAGGTRVMPAAAPAADDEPRARRSLPAWWPWMGAALGTLLVVLLLVWLADRDPGAPVASAPDSPTAAATPPEETTQEQPSPKERPTTAPPEPSGIQIDADDFIGLSKEEAKKRLEDSGLKVKEETVENDGSGEEGTVVDVEPTGTLEEGDELTLFVLGKPPENTEDEEPSGPDGEGPPGQETKDEDDE